MCTSEVILASHPPTPNIARLFFRSIVFAWMSKSPPPHLAMMLRATNRLTCDAWRDTVGCGMLVKSERRRVSALVLLAAVMLACNSVALAQDDASRAMARQLGEEGLDAFHAGEVSTAEQK